MPTASSPFEFVSHPRLRFGPGRVNELAELVRERELTRTAIVTDSVLIASMPVATVAEVIDNTGAEVVVEAADVGEPTSMSIDRVATRLRPFRPQIVVGVGGGSSMDTAKVVRPLIDDSAGHVEDYLGTGNFLPETTSLLVLVPTTAGTGSEVNQFAVVEHLSRKQKLVMSSPVLAADIALVDSQLTHGLPPAVTAATGFDALTHAIEAFSSRLASPVSDALAERAIALAAAYLRQAYSDPDAEARAGMAEAATLAGIAFANAQLGFCHALSGPIGARTHVAHGVANGLVLPAVVRFNRADLGARYDRLAELLGADPVSWIDVLCDDLAFPRRLGDLGVTSEDLPMLARDAMLSRQVQMNPRLASDSDAARLLASVL